MILVFTDFGERASYVGQMTAVLHRAAPEIRAVTLTSFAPAFDPYRSAYLLAAESAIARPGDVVLAVVDPGVGTDRAPVAIQADGVWYVGPDNGLFALVARRAGERAHFTIAWRPERLSASFHGRDLFAPTAAWLARGITAGLDAAAPSAIGADWPDELDEVVFVDDYGNAMTGRRAATLAAGSGLAVPAVETPLRGLRTFADDAAGTGFWYENAIGLVEIAARETSAAARFSLAVGTPVTPVPLPEA
jgi:S-adenosylmethionine hydrolase